MKKPTDTPADAHDARTALRGVQMRRRGVSIARIQAALRVSRHTARKPLGLGEEQERRQASRDRHEFNNATHVLGVALLEVREKAGRLDEQALLDEVRRSLDEMKCRFRAVAVMGCRGQLST